MRRRLLLLLALATCAVAFPAAPAQIDLTVAAAWKGWARPGRATEVDIRLRADAATAVVVDLVAGRQTVHTELTLQPGVAVRLQMPVPSADTVDLRVDLSGGPPLRREIGIAQSESPLLGVALVTDAAIQLDGFHAVVLASDDLPRNASAYASVDALLLDGATLAALDQRQLGALLAHAAECGRIVVLNADPRVRDVLAGAGGCGGRALMGAASIDEAKDMLAASLASSLASALAPGSLGELARPERATWNRVAAALAVYFAAALLVALFVTSWPVGVLVPALAAVAALALLHAMQPAPQLVVWSEGESGAQVARYQAWQRFPGLVRARARVPIPQQLASAVQPCEPTQAVRLDFDASRGLATLAEFETRLFRQVTLCYAGSFPMSRSVQADARAEGSRHVRNVGTTAWPRGVLLAAGRVHDLPALGPGDSAVVEPKAGQPLADAVHRMARTRAPSDGVAALWELDLGGVEDVPAGSKGWLLVSAARP